MTEQLRRETLELLAKGARPYSGESVKMAKQLLAADAAHPQPKGWVMLTPAWPYSQVVEYLEGSVKPPPGLHPWYPVYDNP